VIRIRTLLTICMLALPIPAAVGCGGDDGETGNEEPQEVLDQTFDNENRITSGNLELTFSVSVEGESGGSFEATMEGPFQGDPEDERALPQANLSTRFSGESRADDQEVAFDARVVVTEDNLFVEYEDEIYEVGSNRFTSAKEEAESAPQESEGGSAKEAVQQACTEAGLDPEACDFDFGSWLTGLENEGTEDIEGTESIHITGDLDVTRILNDLGAIVASLPDDSPGFDPSELEDFAEAVPEASFDVFSSAEDRTWRGLDLNLQIDPQTIAAGLPIPIGVIDVDLSARLSDVNEEQTIEAPSGPARPIEELLEGTGLDFGDLISPGAPDFGGEGAPDLGGDGGADPGADIDPDKAQAYLECIGDAESDPEAIDACRSELE
jgi:hypothetical protein